VTGVGSILAGYRLDSVVGRGASATVYAATELADARRVAVKVLAPHLRAHAAVRERFESAARLQQGLAHAGVLDVEEVLESGEDAFVVMRLVGGGTLAELIADGTLTAERTVGILRQVADALDFAHAAGVVHGDVKPRNVLVDEDDVAYLADFGLASAVAQVSPAASSPPGTIGYSAPERLRGEPPSPPADVYAFACVLYECLTGRVPFDHDSAAAVVGGHLYNVPPSASELLPGVPAELDAILARGLAKDAGARPASARELVDAAAAVLARLGPVLPAGPARREEPRARAALEDTLDDPLPVLPAPPAIEIDEGGGVSWPLAIAAVLVLVLSAVTGLLLGRRAPGEDPGRPVAGAALVLRAPSGWKRVTAPAPAAGPQRAIVLVPRERPRATMLAAGGARGDPPALVPRSVAEGAAGPRELARLDGGVAYRYRRSGTGPFAGGEILYVLPGPERSAVVSCRWRPGSPWREECEGIAGTLRVRRGIVYDPTPSRQLAATYNAAMRALRAARNSGLSLLAKAETRRAQVRAAAGLAVAYRTTAAAMRRARPTPIARPVTDTLVSALDRAGVGYTRLAASARRGDAAAYAAAQALIRGAEDEIRHAREDLVELGYSA
jgi:tRNA A-37 threonylcarbamoyl transferase component Bud32